MIPMPPILLVVLAIMFIVFGGVVLDQARQARGRQEKNRAVRMTWVSGVLCVMGIACAFWAWTEHMEERYQQRLEQRSPR